MASKSQRQEGSDSILSALNVAIEALNLAKEISAITPAKAAFGSVSALLAMIRVRSAHSAELYFMFTFIQDSMANQQDYVDLGMICSNICSVLDRGLKGRRLDELDKSVLGAIELLTAWVEPMVRGSSGQLTKVSIAEPLLRCRKRSSSKENGMWSLECSTRRTTRTRLQLGDRNSTGSFTFSTYVYRVMFGDN
jgi:hypothetical protein